MYIRQRLRESDRYRDDARDRDKYLVSIINEAKGTMKEARERECNTWDKVVGDINEEITDMEEEMDITEGNYLLSITTK